MVRKLPRFLTPLDVAEMFSCSEGRDQMLLKCLYYLGLRNSEAQNIRIEDIDRINKTVTVRGKGKDRCVPIPGAFGEELKEFIGKRSEGYLFDGRANGRLSGRHIRRIVNAAAAKAGVRKAGEVHPHTMRHSYATHLQNSGVPLNVIQNILGHERLVTTVIYTQMGVEKTRSWIEKALENEKTAASPRSFAEDE